MELELNIFRQPEEMGKPVRQLPSTFFYKIPVEGYILAVARDYIVTGAEEKLCVPGIGLLIHALACSWLWLNSDYALKNGLIVGAKKLRDTLGATHSEAHNPAVAQRALIVHQATPFMFSVENLQSMGILSKEKVAQIKLASDPNYILALVSDEYYAQSGHTKYSDYMRSAVMEVAPPPKT